MNETDILYLIGRILFGGYFTMMGINHFAQKANMVGYAKMKNVPHPELAVAVGGILLLIGGLGILSGMYVQIAALALVIFLVPVTLKMHAFWADTDPMMKQADIVNFTKNIALLGAVLMMF